MALIGADLGKLAARLTRRALGTELKLMNAKDKQLAEVALGRLCNGSEINGIRFGPVLQILLSHVNPDGEEPIFGQVYLNLGSSWTVFSSRPLSFPNGEDEVPEMSAEEEIRTICDLRQRIIVKAEVGEVEPHLVLTLDDGRVVFVNGRHDIYECWDMGVAFTSARRWHCRMGSQEFRCHGYMKQKRK